MGITDILVHPQTGEPVNPEQANAITGPIVDGILSGQSPPDIASLPRGVQAKVRSDLQKEGLLADETEKTLPDEGEGHAPRRAAQ